jgi:uncharacterized protein YjbI with pentapeptide repeats
VGQDFLAAFLAGAFLAGAFLAGAFLAGAFLAGAFLAGAFATAVFLAGAAFLAGAVFLAAAFLAGAFLAGAFLAAAFLAGAAALAGDVLQVSAGGELRHRRLLGLDPRAGLRVAHPASFAHTLLERAEARDRDLLAPGDLARDGVQNALQRLLRGLPVPLVTRGERVDELRLVH